MNIPGLEIALGVISSLKGLGPDLAEPACPAPFGLPIESVLGFTESCVPDGGLFVADDAGLAAAVVDETAAA